MEKRLNGLTIIRVTAVLMVVMVHFCQSWGLPDILQSIVLFGQYGVQLFFLLSGFLIFASLSRCKEMTGFYKKRAVRILPIYYTVILINFIFFGLIFRAVPVDSTGLGWLRYVLFLNTTVPSNSWDYWNNLSSLWSIPAFIVFYALAPLLYKLITNLRATFFASIVFILINATYATALSLIGGGAGIYGLNTIFGGKSAFVGIMDILYRWVHMES